MAGNVFPRAAGYANLPNGVFTPDVWSLRLLDRYYEESLTPQIVNMDYEGEIKNYGDRVRIRREPEVITRRYYKGQALVHQAVEDEEEQFDIDYGCYWCVPVDDVERRQIDIAYVQGVEKNAARQSKRFVDQQVLGNIYADAAAANVMANRTVTPNNIPELIVDAGVILDEAFAPDEDRWIVVPYWFKGHLKLNPIFVSAEKMGDDKSIIRSGYVGDFDRFKVYCSPNLAVVSLHTQVTFGCKTAVTFATQYVKTETLRNQWTFGDILRGLQVFGWHTVQPTHLGKVGVLKG